VSDELLQEVGLERHQVPRLGSAGLKKRNKAQQKEAEWFGMPVNDAMAAGTTGAEEGQLSDSAGGVGYLRGPVQLPFAGHDQMYQSQGSPLDQDDGFENKG
jgi:hypothetical protein